ncbi:hypothetical protein CWI38_0038p0010 [Hamiltosporidium tvaerminnensis]|uniref:Uncharacterized protein n=1 Tax=Hamiltosporidium tvaerminnensis TaxID=1176355 RepID=A0A4Q9M505_9MICR|nr:hypothetical protein CWI38_0038p0010 [Hamiltosporidium tvaerminnensis]
MKDWLIDPVWVISQKETSMVFTQILRPGCQSDSFIYSYPLSTLISTRNRMKITVKSSPVYKANEKRREVRPCNRRIDASNKNLRMLNEIW